MGDKCKDCVFFASAILCCMAMENEGMRVFNPEQKACNYFKDKKRYNITFDTEGDEGIIKAVEKNDN